MYKLCKTEQSAARQRSLEEGLLAAMLTKRYEEITVSDLCTQMQIPRKSFYRYFSSKDGALYALIDHTLMEFEGFSSPYQAGQGRTLQWDLERFFLFWLHHKGLLNSLERSGMSGVLMERSISHALSANAMPLRFLPRNDPEFAKHVVMFSVCGLMSMVLTWHHEGYRQPASAMAQIAGKLLVQPLFPKASELF